jgi:hypothetical protein
LLALVLVGVAFLCRGRLRAGSAALFWFLLIAAVLTCIHPNRKSRFLHSWVAVGWAVAGAGAAQLLPRGAGPRLRRGSTWVNGAALGGIALAQVPGLLVDRGYVPEGGPRADLVSDQDVAECYLPALAGSRRVAILSNLPIRFWTAWTFEARYGRPLALETDVKGFGPSATDNRQTFRNWLQKTSCDHLVLVSVGRRSPFFFAVPYAAYEEIPELMAGQDLFPHRQHWDLPEYGCTVTVWSRTQATAWAGPPPCRPRSHLIGLPHAHLPPFSPMEPLQWMSNLPAG